MSMNESVAYLKGLAEGLEIDTDKKEGKLLSAIIDVLQEIAAEVTDVQEICEEYGELLDAIDEDLGSIEEDFYGDEDEDDDDDEEDPLYEVTCPSCGDTVYLDEDMLLEGDMECPNCGQLLEFDLEACDCGCDCCCEDDEDEDECDCEECEHE